MKLQKVRGKNLPVSFIRLWNNTMKKAFGEDEPLNPRHRADFARDIFFILKDKERILSVCRLRPFKLKFLGKSYSLEGISDMVSLEKHRGFGKKLMFAAIKSLKQTKKTGIGSCQKKNAPFYLKCGFKIAPNKAPKFPQLGKNKKLIKGAHGEDIIYIEGRDNFMKRALLSKKQILIPIKL